MTEVFAFEWCSCIYEAGFSVQTLHTTKRGALKAMIECVNHRWQVQRDLQLERGGWAKGERRDPLWDEAWRVRAIPLYNAKSEPTARLLAQVGSTDGLCHGD